MTTAKHRAPRRRPTLPTTPTMAAVTAAPLTVAALGVLTAPTAEATVGPASSVNPQAGTYTARSGDTLSAIARDHGVTGGWQTLAAVNGLSDPDRLAVGQRLSLPGSGPTASTPITDTGRSYLVRSGDTLGAIAARHSVPGGWRAIATANHLADPDRLSVGQHLVLPGAGPVHTAPASGHATSSGHSGSSGHDSGEHVTSGGHAASSTGGTTSRPSPRPRPTPHPRPSSGSSGHSSSGDSQSGDAQSGNSQPPAASSTSGSSVVAYARGYFGVPYAWGGNDRSGLDCSGLTSQVLEHFGYSPPRTADAQYHWTQHISESEARPGDLVFGYFEGGSAEHVGIYIGNDQMIDAPDFGEVVGVHHIARDARFGRLP